jgi:hypothetical protein
MTDSPRTHTKGDVLQMAYDELAITNGVFPVSPEMQRLALNRFDAMMAEWEADGVALGYAYPSVYAQSLPAEASGLQDAVVQAVSTNLALRVGPTIGKTVSGETRKAANRGMNMLRVRTLTIPAMQLPSRLPKGQGNRLSLFKSAFFPPSDAEAAL